jgi:hypothetical protein
MNLRIESGVLAALLALGAWGASAIAQQAAPRQQAPVSQQGPVSPQQPATPPGPKTTFPEQKPKSDAGTSATAGESGEGPEEGEADQEFSSKRNNWFLRQRAYPFAHIPAGARTRALQQHLALKAAGARAKLPVSNTVKSAHGPLPADAFSGLTWNFDGPAYIGFGPGTPPWSGRATSLAINPTNPLIMYLGTAAGGVWETTDGGNTWAATTDTQASLAIGAMAIDPNTPTTIYAGTGEADYSVDDYYGQGLLKSTDGGNTWTLISAPFVSGGSAAPFAQIAIQPGNSSVLLAATESGLYRSADAGMTWTNELPSYASSVIFDPSNTNTAYAGLNGYYSSFSYSGLTAAIYKSADGGMTWAPLTGGVGSPLPAWNTVIRTALTLDSGGNLLAGTAPSSFGTGTLYKSSDGGNTWAALTAPGDGLDYYRDWIVSVPGSPTTLYTGGVNLHQSLDGGVTWTTPSSSPPLWADTHAGTFSPDGTRMYLMDDGGLYVTTTSPAAGNPTLISLNNGIASMTFYPGFGINSGGATIVGSQDHGTQIGTAGSRWSFTGGGFVCGDGGPVVLDAAGVVAYAHCQGSGLAYWMSSATGGAAVTNAPYPYGWVAAQTGITTSDRASWVPPIATDPSNVNVLYTGTYRVYQSTNGAQQWALISPDLTQDTSSYTFNPPALNTIAVAPTDENTVYAGADDGTMSVTTNALSGVGATWTTLTGLPNRSISKILVAPDSAQDVYVAMSGFGSGHIFHSTNGGTTWTDLSGNLPDTPMDSIALDPTLANTIYLASDTGVYVTSNGGTSWEVLGTNLPNVVVQDIMIVASSRLLRAVTHGRGAWDLTLPLGATITPTVTVTPSLSTISTTQDLNVGITVAGANGNPTPTGSVTLTGGGYTSAATPLSGGTTTIDIPAGSLATGSDTLTATYTPDAGSTSTYNSASGTATVTVIFVSVWIVDGSGGSTGLNDNGTGLTSGADPGENIAIAIDTSGDVWTIGSGTPPLEDISPAGVLLNQVAAGTGGLDLPAAIAIDGNSQVWVANGNNSVSQFTNAGAALSPASGFTDGSLLTPGGIAIDLAGSVWITNEGNNSVTRFLGVAAPVAPLATAVANSTTGAKP